MPNVPNTNTRGQILTSVGTGQNDSYWDDANSGTIRIGRTYCVQDVLATASGGTDYIPHFEVPVPPGQTVTFIGISTSVRALNGGTVTAEIDQNGSAVAGLSAVTVTASETETDATNPVACADGDLFAPVLTVTGDPDNLSMTFIFDVTP